MDVVGGDDKFSSSEGVIYSLIEKTEVNPDLYLQYLKLLEKAYNREKVLIPLYI